MHKLEFLEEDILNFSDSGPINVAAYLITLSIMTEGAETDCRRASG